MWTSKQTLLHAIIRIVFVTTVFDGFTSHGYCDHKIFSAKAFNLDLQRSTSLISCQIL
ncbi:predicted protein [Arabidopsis lyrata subsp. lyrata]|uniref:Predicted protein n=1 Tax=Arabidopsis lyrata subsp. lyrata TaxID=81972 RepID=D7KHQ7_ARALL|nr:predicted protein [Arabidopsis lyrata subsp. lyrata]